MPADFIAAIPTCVHRWFCEDPIAGESRGTCQKCGSIRVFDARPRITFGDIYELTNREG